MYPYVTLMSLCGDVRLLAGRVAGVAPLFTQTLAENEGEALLGVVAPVDREMIEAGLAELAEAWDAPDHFPPRVRNHPGIMERDRRLAFCLGGLVQLASGLAAGDERACFQQDALILSEAILGLDRHAFEGFLVETYGTQGGLREAFSAFLLALFQRSLAESHTLIPNMIHVQGWMDSLIYGTIQLERWIAGFAQTVYPDDAVAGAEQSTPDLTGFYAAADPAVQAAGALRQSRILELDNDILNVDRNRSAYGKALCRCLEAVTGASRAWQAQAVVGEGGKAQ